MGEIPQQLRKSIALQVDSVPAMVSSPLGTHAARYESLISLVDSWLYIAAGYLPMGI